MSDSTVPNTQTPLFLGRPPLLVVPAVLILVLSVKFAPRKSIIGNRDVLSPSQRFAMMFPFPVLNLCLSIWLYTLSKGESPLTLETPLTLASSEFPEARVCIILLIVAALMFSLSQLMSVPVHGIATLVAQPVKTGNFWMSMMLVAGAHFGWQMTALFLLFFHSPLKQTFAQRVEAILLWSQFCVIVYDSLMAAVYYRMHKAAPAETKPLLYRLSGAAFLTLMISGSTMCLRSLVFLFDLPQHGWLDVTLQIGGYVTALHMHMIAFFLMWNEFVKYNEAQVAKGRPQAGSVDPPKNDAAEMVNA